jgi:four helix bundle protein
MQYKRFEDLPVWQTAVDLAARMFQWTAQDWFRGKVDLANQLQRATLSISNNIAEGFERGTTNELLQFLYIARGSAGEVGSMLCVMERMKPTEILSGEIAEFRVTCESVSRQIFGWTNKLKNSDINGQRHLNDQTKQAFEQEQRREAFQKRLDNINEEARRKREGGSKGTDSE